MQHDQPEQPHDDGGEPGVMASIPLEEHQSMLRRLHRSDELIKQLKHIVKAQHGKIEEFREKLEINSIGRSPYVAAYEAQDFEKAKDENQELRARIGRLQAELSKAKQDNGNMRKVIRRLKNMLQDTDTGDLTQSQTLSQGAFFLPSLQASLQPTLDGTDDSFMLDESLAGYLPQPPASAPVHPGSLSARETRSVPFSRTFPAADKGSSSRGEGSKMDSSEQDEQPRRHMLKRGKKQKTWRDEPEAVDNLPPFSRTQRLTNSISMFWRDIESPASVLRALADVASRLLADREVQNITVFIVDSWLREVVSSDDKGEAPVIFYLGQGKTELQALKRSEVATKISPPSFGDLQVLPYRSKTVAAFAVTTPNRSRIWAVLQVALEDSKSSRSNASFVPKMLSDRVKSADASRAHFADSHVSYLQLVSGVVGGILVHIEKCAERRQQAIRTQAIMDGAVNVSKARSLADFEQRVRQLFTNFFSVNTIRVLIYDKESHMLLISSSQMGRKGCLSISISKGILGQCVQKRQVVNVNDVTTNPYVDPISDGLQRSGKPVVAHAAMLVGPMIVENSQSEERIGSELVGVVQLLEKKKRSTIDGSIQISEFTPEEQMLFSQLLSVCSNAGARTIMVQQLQAKLTNTAHSLTALLSG
eukprot:TRINITY_DN15145_c0_g1_i3.p1 TRINITY_DN15145_c0_g1~~TRINITY_DN15145_c0_g1_i3.p1  ORF type:complete len:660 (+),score=99.58 TRINITY_DN15145_c0_g1_i3:42-1982(+)